VPDVICAECGFRNYERRNRCGQCGNPLNGPLAFDRVRVYDLSKQYISENHSGMSEQTRYAILQFAEWVDQRSSVSASESQT